VTIKRKTETIKLRREGDGWAMLEPVKARGDRGAVDGVVTTLVTARVDREIDAKPARLADFGLDPPETEISLEVKGQKEPLALAIGGKNPTGAWVYGKEGAKPAVLALSEIVSRDASKPAVEFRDKTVLAFDRRSVTGLDLEIGGDRISLEAQEGGKWRIVKPGPYPGDGDRVGDFLDKLGAAKAREFVPVSPATAAKLGLDRPASVTLWLGKDKDRSSKTLLVGRAEDDKKTVHVMRPGESEAMVTGEEVWTALPKTVAVLRDKVVVAYAYDKVKRVEVESPRGQVALERDGSGWKLTAPEPLRADAGAVNNLLWNIRDLRASGYLAEEAAAIPRHLGKPEVTVKIWEEGAPAAKTLLVAPSRDTRGGQPAAVAAVAGQGPVMLIDAKALTELARTADDLRDKMLLPPFELTDVKRARFVSGGKPVLVERKGESEWKLVEPSRGAAKEAKITDLLLTLKTLRWKEIASPKGDDAARFGLDRPQIEVTLVKGDGSELATLLVGREEGGVAYVRMKASPVIYSVEGKLLGDLKKAPTEIPAS
jgi:hypothetical protein